MDTNKKGSRQQNWEKDHVERTTILTSSEKDKFGWTLKARIKAAAADVPESVNQWIIGAIMDRLEGRTTSATAPGTEDLAAAVGVAQVQAAKTGETAAEWLTRAANEQAKRDEVWAKMGVKPGQG